MLSKKFLSKKLWNSAPVDFSPLRPNQCLYIDFNYAPAIIGKWVNWVAAFWRRQFTPVHSQSRTPFQLETSHFFLPPTANAM